MKKLYVPLVALVFLVAGFLIGAQKQNELTVLPEETTDAASVSMMIDTGDSLIGFQDIDIVAGDTAWSVLERTDTAQDSLSISADTYGDLGVLINAMNGYENGFGDQWWQYWVNNQYAEVAADKYPVSDGDVILWKFTNIRYIEH